jgi:hypothetical protein
MRLATQKRKKNDPPPSPTATPMYPFPIKTVSLRSAMVATNGLGFVKTKIIEIYRYPVE